MKLLKSKEGWHFSDFEFEIGRGGDKRIKVNKVIIEQRIKLKGIGVLSGVRIGEKTCEDSIKQF